MCIKNQFVFQFEWQTSNKLYVISRQTKNDNIQTTTYLNQSFFLYSYRNGSSVAKEMRTSKDGIVAFIEFRCRIWTASIDYFRAPEFICFCLDTKYNLYTQKQIDCIGDSFLNWLKIVLRVLHFYSSKRRLIGSHFFIYCEYSTYSK